MPRTVDHPTPAQPKPPSDAPLGEVLRDRTADLSRWRAEWRRGLARANTAAVVTLLMLMALAVGSLVQAFRADRERERAVRAEAEGKDKLREAYTRLAPARGCGRQTGSVAGARSGSGHSARCGHARRSYRDAGAAGCGTGILPPNVERCPQGPQGPPEKLSLAFATADVVILSWRLQRMDEHLRDGEQLAVRALPARYVNLDRNKTYVASITVEPVNKD